MVSFPCKEETNALVNHTVKYFQMPGALSADGTRGQLETILLLCGSVGRSWENSSMQTCLKFSISSEFFWMMKNNILSRENESKNIKTSLEGEEVAFTCIRY